jgi:hypothetical protein
MIPNQDGLVQILKIFKTLIQFYYFMKTSLARVGIISDFEFRASFCLSRVCCHLQLSFGSVRVSRREATLNLCGNRVGQIIPDPPNPESQPNRSPNLYLNLRVAFLQFSR